MKKSYNVLNRFFLSLLALLGLSVQSNAQCAGGEVEVFIDVITDNYGYELYWELTPTNAGCGTAATIFTGGNTLVGCGGAGLQAQNPGGYANNVTVTEPQTATGFCLTIGDTFDIVAIDDWGDGGSQFVSVSQAFSFAMPATSASDVFTFVAVQPPSDDLAAANPNAEYTLMPRLIADSSALVLDVLNAGTTDATDAVVKADVFLDGTFQYSTSSVPTAVTSGATVSISAGELLTPVNGTYTVIYSVSSALLTDNNVANDSIGYNVFVNDRIYARDDGTPANAVGINSGQIIMGNTYEIGRTVQLDSAWAPFGGLAAGDTTRFLVYSTTANTPTTIIGQSAEYIVTPADTVGGFVLLQLPLTDLSSNALVLTPGTYFIAAEQYASSGNYALYCAANIITPNKGSFYNINGGGWNPLESAGLGPIITMVRGFFSEDCSALVASTQVDSAVQCNGDNGTVSAVGGASYLWSTGETTQAITGAAGTYSVTISDGGSCSAVDSVVLTEPAAYSLTVDSFQNVSCFGGADGLVNITIGGATPPYTYNWSNGATTDDLAGLIAGVYTGTVTDANGCVIAAPVTITEPSAVVSSAVDNGNGSATASASGGTSPYTYLWSDGQATATATGLISGSYDVTVTDANGCTDVTTVNVVVTGVDNIASLTQLDVFPTPADEVLNINISLDNAEEVSFSVVNVAGIEVMNRNLGSISGDRIELNIEDLPAGVYTMYFTIGDNKTNRRLIISRK